MEENGFGQRHGAIVGTRRLQNATTQSVTRRAEAISSNLARVALWHWDHLGIAVSLST